MLTDGPEGQFEGAGNGRKAEPDPGSGSSGSPLFSGFVSRLSPPVNSPNPTKKRGRAGEALPRGRGIDRLQAQPPARGRACAQSGGKAKDRQGSARVG